MSSGTTKLINKDMAMKKIIALTLCAFASSTVLAALPPLSPEVQQIENLAKAKSAYGDRVGAFQLCQAQNKVAERFRVSGTPAPAACVAPPPFVAPVAVAPAAK
jgi:hypothetical protein